MPPHTAKDYPDESPEKPRRDKQLNLNTIIGLLLGALIVFCIGKLDTINTATIETKGDIRMLNADMSTVKNQLNNLVTKGEMATVIGERDREIEGLNKRILETERRLNITQKP